MKEKFKSIRIKLFVTLCVVVIIIIAFLILTNNIVLESFYLYSKTKTLISIYDKINNYYSQGQVDNSSIKLELEKASINNNFDIVIVGENDINVYSSNRNFLPNINDLNSMNHILQRNENVVYKNDKVKIRKFEDTNNRTYIYDVYCDSR